MVPAPAIADRKIVDYLLNVDHVDGGPKARYFIARGFSLTEPGSFIMALLEHGEAKNLVSSADEGFGPKYVYEGQLQTPDGANPRVRSIWQTSRDGFFRLLVTAYPF